MQTQFKIEEKGFSEVTNHPYQGLESQKTAILMTLVGVAKCHNKPYCFVSQNRQLQLLSKYHSWNISRRTLNRRLKELECEGYFVRIRRHKQGQDGKIQFASTLYKFKAKLFMWLHRIGRAIVKIFSFYRVPRASQYISTEQNKIYKEVPLHVEILGKSPDPPWLTLSKIFSKEGLRH